MAERKERGFTINGIVQREINGWTIQILPNDRSERARTDQEAWLRENEGVIVKFARETVRHPEE
ncbi:MAG: hypothetical protein M1587_06815 [Thaumarchaeota archaeon]|nr:hypothetical protein [Nitrososphaerota archaeon]MDG6905492.1 hypothetical protein [Nitrososphaerota archaeon]